MDRQAGFLLALLFLANFLTIEAGDTSIPVTGQLSNLITVNPGSPWAATCKDLDGSQKVADWTRDGVPLATEIRDQEFTVNSTSNASTISATSAKKQHEGLYRCSPESHDVHFVRVISESTPALQPQSKAASNILANTTGNPLFGDLFALAVNATLTCKNTSSNLPVQWKKNNEIVTENNEHYEIQDGGKTIFFKKAVKTLLGNYSCLQGEPSRILENYQVIEIPTVTLPPNSSVVEGEKFTLTASFSDTIYSPKDLNVSISWTVNSTTYTESKGRVVLSADDSTGIENWKITILDTTMNDHSQIGGPIICKAKYLNVPGQPADEGATYLVVKDKLAALWPFLGICLEVVVLCAIILVYEKKRNKAELEESDTDQSPDTKPAANKDSEVRHRK